MLSKNALKYYSTLLNKKYRERERKFIVEGKRLFFEALHSDYECEIVCCTNSFYEENKSLLDPKLKEYTLELLKESDFKKLTNTEHPQGILGIFKKKKISFIFEAKSSLIVGLESISDPGNLGTIFRNCDWFGIEQVILSKNCAEIYNPKVLRASMGSIFHLDIYDTVDLYSELDVLLKNNFKIITADLNGKNIYETDKIDKGIIVFANEAHGPSKKLLEISNMKLTIPRQGKAESLNVASASAVILSELTK